MGGLEGKTAPSCTGLSQSCGMNRDSENSCQEIQELKSSEWIFGVSEVSDFIIIYLL